jgi:probable HAF family extracellular repeat protein
VTLHISPDTATLGLGQTRGLPVAAADTHGNVFAPAATWTSSDDAVLRVDALGVATGLREGSVTVAAKAGTLLSSAMIRVVAPPVARIDQAPRNDTTLDTPTGRYWIPLSGSYTASPRVPVARAWISLDGAQDSILPATSPTFSLDREFAPGDHTLTFAVEDVLGQRATAQRRFTVASLARSYALTFLGTNGGTDSDALDLNEAGDVVGYSLSSSGSTRAVLWHGGAAIDLREDAGDESSRATAINASGEVVGFNSALCRRSFTWRNGEQTLLDGCGLTAIDLNDRGSILFAGNQLLHDGILEQLPTATADGYLIQVRRLNGSDQALGSYFCCSGGGGGQSVTVIMTPGGAIERALFVAQPGDLNDRGDVVGVHSGGSVWEPNDGMVRLRGREPIELHWTARFSGNPYGVLRVINNPGRAVGFRGGACAAACGLDLWEAGRIYRLELTDPSWSVDRIARINDGGQIVGHAINLVTGQKGAVLLTPVP